MPNCDKKRKRKHGRNIERYLKLHSKHLNSSHCHSHHEVFNDDDISEVVNDDFYPPEICIQLMLKRYYVVGLFIPNTYIYIYIYIIRIGEKKPLYMYNICMRKNMSFCFYWHVRIRIMYKPSVWNTITRVIGFIFKLMSRMFRMMVPLIQHIRL